MTLGKGNLIYLMAQQSPWAYKIFPEIKPALPNRDITPEDMIGMGIDFVMYTPGMTEEQIYSDFGLKTVCAFSAEKRPENIDQFKENFKRQISLFGNLLGVDAAVRAQKYNHYFDQKVQEILSVTTSIQLTERPTVYYGGLKANMKKSQGKGSVMHWNTEIAGGTYLPQKLGDNHAEASMEEIVAWNPDIILISGFCNSTDSIMSDRQWAHLSAVKNKRFFLIPQGVYTWDHASGENVLMMLYLAKIFHQKWSRSLDHHFMLLG